MIKAIQAAAKISKNLESDCSDILQDYNLHKQFQGIYDLRLDTKVTNILICAIIYSYDANSNWCDLKKTSHDDKINILNGLGADFSNPIYDDFIDRKVDEINDSIGDFLDLQTDWRIAQINRSRDFHSKAMREQEPSFTGIDDDKTAKAKENFGKFLREALNHRKLCDEYIIQVEKDYVNLNHRTKQDFGIDYTEAVTKRDIYSWREFIKGLNENKASTT